MTRGLLILTLLCGCNSNPVAPDDMGGGGDDGPAPMGPRPTARKDIDGVLVTSNRMVYVVGGDTAPFDNNVPVGQLPKALIDETWRYDLAKRTWEQLTPTGSPGARGGYALAYDSKRDRVLLFAGRKGTTMAPPTVNDLWALDVATATWTQLQPGGTVPSARLGHRMIYDAAGDRVIVFAGEPNNLFNNANIVGDTLELSFAASADGTWSQLFASDAAGAPPKRRDVALAVDTKRKLMVMFGGAFSFDTYTDELWAFDLTANTWRKLTTTGIAPSKRFAMRMDYDAARDQFIVFGGHDPFTIGLQNDSYTLVLDAGGTSGTFAPLLAGDTGIRDLSTVDHNSPERRQRHAQVIDGDTLWIFGGGTDCSAIDDTATLSLASPTAWKAVIPANVGETCVRRAMSGQTCPSDCGNPF